MALYDPNEFPVEAPVTTDFTLADVLAWARTKPAGREYDFNCASYCAVAQFGRETGRPELIDLLSSELDEKCPGLLAVASGKFGSRLDWTFGAFADRLEKALSA